MMQLKKYCCAVKPTVLFACLAAFMLPPIVVTTAGAQTSAPVSADDPAYVASRQAFEALPENERKAIQDALIWTGVYNATAGGSFGRQTYAGIVAYQTAAGAPANGILGTAFAERLKAAGAAARAEAGFRIVRDEKTGIDIGVPFKLLPKQGGNPGGGSRWQSVDEKITFDTRSLPGGTAELQALYERSIAAAPGRKITYKLQKPDFFVVTGETASGEFYTRYALGADGLRGFSLGYDKSSKAAFNRVMIAIANSFIPFPAEEVPVAETQPAASTGNAEKSGGNPPTARVQADASKVFTGIRVGPRQIVTVGAVCRNPMIAGAAAKLVRQSDDLSLLETAADTDVPVLPARDGPMPDGSAVVVIGWDAGAKAVGVASGSAAEGGMVTVALQAGGRGGLVFDRNGAVAGMVGVAKTPVRAIAGVMMPASYSVVRTKDIQDFTGSADSFAGSASGDVSQSAGAIAATASQRIVEITCP